MNKLEKIREDIENKYGNGIPNTKNKISVTFSIDINIAKRLREYCEEKGMFISHIVERVIKEYLDLKSKE